MSLSKFRFLPTRRDVLFAAASAGGLRLSGQSRLPAILARLRSPVLFEGDATTAYRDPAALYHDGWFYLYFTLVRKEADGIAYSYVAWRRSRDLQRWSETVAMTPRDKALDFGSPGDVVRFQDRWVLCLQTYPRPHGERYGNQESRVWTMSSTDLRHWSPPELLAVRGPAVAKADMGRR